MSTRNIYLSIILLFICFVLVFPRYSYSAVLFEDNFDSHPDWLPSQPTNTQSSLEVLLNDGSGQPVPTGYNGWRMQASVYGNKGNDTIKIDSSNSRGSSGKAFTYQSERCDNGNCGWPSDGLLDIKLNPIGYNELYVRFFMKFDPNWIWSTGGQSPIQKLIHISHWDGTGTRYGMFSNGPNKPLLIGDIARWGGGTSPTNYFASHFYEGLTSEFGYGDDTNRNFPKTGGGNADWSEPGGPGDGNWHCWEFYVKMNSVLGAADGEHKLWYDGQLISSRTNLVWSTVNGQNNPRRLWNYVWLGGNNYNHYATTTVPEPEQWYAIDDLVISTTYVGPNYGIIPSPPTGLRVQ